jgi:aryl-alcohol dehydrogenase-like predicted oxidoreductase
VWSPLGWGRLTGKIRRNQPMPEVSRERVNVKDCVSQAITSARDSR